jgi:uncharacterized protein YcsI (UPF0317 family)
MTSQNTQVSFTQLRSSSLEDLRLKLRANLYSKHTAGLCAGHLQCNLVILPKIFANDFEKFCHANPKPCPLIKRSEAGATDFGTLDPTLDLRYDLPLYRIFKDGRFECDVNDVQNFWRDDFVTFAVGCSFSFENALQAQGMSLRHIEQNKTVPMYTSNLPTKSVGPFSGPTVVSMRPIHRDHLEQTCAISERYPHAHGGPVHIGDPSRIGITDLTQPQWGDAVPISAHEVPVFWACGVTTQLAVANAKPDISITHAPGCMLILNVPDSGAKQKQ